MEDITIFDDKTKTETTIMLNNQDDVIGLTTYFESPRPLSDFWNVKLTFANSRKPLPPIRNSRGPIDARMNNNVGPNNSSIDANSRMRTTISNQRRPCGGSNQAPCK